MRRALKLVLWILISVPCLASAEWYKDYEEAMDLIKKNQYAQAIPRLQAALRQKSTEGSNIKFYGMKFGDYFPHYYLGRAYFLQKDYDSAMAEFAESEGQGEIQKKRDLFKSLSEFKSIAGAQLAMAKEVKTPPSSPPVTPKPEVPQVAEQRKPAEPEVRKETQLPPITEQPVKVVEAPKKEEAVKKEVIPPPLTVSIPAETPREKARKIARDGARKYFEGDYDGAISSFLQALKVDATDSSSQFLLGCSYAAKYLLSGSQDRKLFENASAAFQKAKRANLAGPAIKSPYISPAILEMYQKTGA